jgi:hypothetical protein
VRPAPVLRKALARLVDLIASGDVNYFYSQDQFKGMRQVRFVRRSSFVVRSGDGCDTPTS